MTWFVLNPDLEKEVIAETHLDPGFELTLAEGWEKEDKLHKKMELAGVESDDEFVNRSRKITESAKYIGEIVLEGPES